VLGFLRGVAEEGVVSVFSVDFEFLLIFIKKKLDVDIKIFYNIYYSNNVTKSKQHIN